jgi:nitrogen-specific signal transduction histidine kinase
MASWGSYRKRDRSAGNRPAAPTADSPEQSNTTVEHTVMLARQQALCKRIKIELQKALDLPEVGHDGDQIHQVLLNVLLNAVQAVMGAGTANVDRSTSTRWLCQRRNPRHRPGIPPYTSPTCFLPFYKTKGNGRGLGLSLARRIVEHHGRIEGASVVTAPRFLRP